MRVSNMTSSIGNTVPNQFLIEGLAAGTFFNGEERLQSGRAFQSYDTMIAFIDRTGQIYLDENAWDYSRTTGKYRNQFIIRIMNPSCKRNVFSFSCHNIPERH